MGVEVKEGGRDDTTWHMNREVRKDKGSILEVEICLAR